MKECKHGSEIHICGLCDDEGLVVTIARAETVRIAITLVPGETYVDRHGRKYQVVMLDQAVDALASVEKP